MGLEPMTSSLPRKCSTAELRRLLFPSQSHAGLRHLTVTNADCPLNYERKTRFELATYSLEGYRSTNWATFAFIKWGEKDSNLRSLATTELQSVPFGHSGIPPFLLNCPTLADVSLKEPPIGIEPMTYWLQVSCSTSWAKEAFIIYLFANWSKCKILGTKRQKRAG